MLKTSKTTKKVLNMHLKHTFIVVQISRYIYLKNKTKILIILIKNILMSSFINPSKYPSIHARDSKAGQKGLPFKSLRFLKDFFKVTKAMFTLGVFFEAAGVCFTL